MNLLEQERPTELQRNIVSISDSAHCCHIDLQSGLILNLNNKKKPERISRLGRKDISVLHMLIKSNGILVTRNQLLDDVWSGRIVTDNVLTVSISNIRKALKLIHPTGDELIVTINGVGYLMDIRDSGLILYCEKEKHHGITE